MSENLPPSQMRREGYSGPPGSSAGPKGQVTDNLTDIADNVKDGIQQMAEVHRTSALGMRQMMNATENLKQATFEAAVIASGESPSGLIESGGASGSITIKQTRPPGSPPTGGFVAREPVITVAAIVGLIVAIAGVAGIYLTDLQVDAITQALTILLPIVLSMLGGFIARSKVAPV